MAHLSLYRKHRPQTFDDVVGQQHITRTLRNAVREGEVSHAYLFTGPRGTGKTTTARILAKALDCEKGPTPDPDATCEQCVDIAEGRHPDVHELDAASRTQVENVREEIIGRVAYAPTRGPWKIYIIDEVHMLSTHSFNALLKTIEEPPEHTVFVLCTTHPHKVPETIHSRCQRFDFHRIGVEDIVSTLSRIAKAEGIEVEDSSLLLVARHAAGGMRDAITTFEQLSSFTGKSISLGDVEGLLGEVDRGLLFELAGLVADRAVADCFRYVARLAESGVDFAEYTRELVAHYRDLYVTAVVGDPAGIVDATDDELTRLAAQAREYGADRLSRVLDVLGELAAELRWSSDPRLSLEVALTRLARPQGELTVEALAERVEALERGTPVTFTAGALPTAGAIETPGRPEERATSVAGPAAEAVAVDGSPVAPSPPAGAAVAGEGVLDRSHVKRAWPAVVAEIKKRKAPRASLFAGVEVDMDADGRTLRVEFPADQEANKTIAETPQSLELLREALGVVFGFVPPFRFQLGRGSASPADESSAPAGSADDGRSSSERLIDELGAEVIAEHPHEETTPARGEETP